MARRTKTPNLLLHVIQAPRFQLVQIELLVPHIDPGDLRSHDLLSRLQPGKPVIVDGSGPIWLYGHISALAAKAPWVACSDPRLGAVVVARSSRGAPSIGTVLPREKFDRFLLDLKSQLTSKKESKRKGPSQVVAIVGPPHSGKTVLLNLISRELQKLTTPGIFFQDVFFIKAAPDGEGKWFQEIPEKQARSLRRKHEFTAEFGKRAAREIKRVRQIKSLVFVDCGGKIDPLQRPIWEQCTHAIVLSSDANLISEWRGAATLSGLEVIAEIESSLESCSEVVRDSRLRLRIGPLERSRRDRWPPLPDPLLKSLLQDIDYTQQIAAPLDPS